MQIILGRADSGRGPIAIILHRHFALSTPLMMSSLLYISRSPVPITTYGNVSKPFSPLVWVATLVILLVLSFMLLGTYCLYYRSGHLRKFHLVKKEELPLNFIIFPLVKITEPDPLPWFKTWSSGKFIVMLWSLFSLFLIMFYTSNLRVKMLTVEYEVPIKTLEDILAYSKKVYLFQGFIRHRCVHRTRYT